MDDLRIGDQITYEGRTYIVRGFDLMSLSQQMAELEDTETGTTSRVSAAHLGHATSHGSTETLSRAKKRRVSSPPTRFIHRQAREEVTTGFAGSRCPDAAARSSTSTRAGCQRRSPTCRGGSRSPAQRSPAPTCGSSPDRPAATTGSNAVVPGRRRLGTADGPGTRLPRLPRPTRRPRGPRRARPLIPRLHVQLSRLRERDPELLDRWRQGLPRRRRPLRVAQRLSDCRLGSSAGACSSRIRGGWMLIGAKPRIR